MNNDPVSILLIEDNPGDARLIKERLLFRQNGRYDLHTATSLAGGLALLAGKSFDIILLDLSLPDSFGTETILTTRKMASETAILVLTGNNDLELGVKAIQLGAQEYLPKAEADTNVLERTIRYAMERFRAERELRQSREEYRSLIDDVFDTSSVAVIIFDRRHAVVWANEAVHSYFGLPPDEVIGMDKRVLIKTRLKEIFTDSEDYAARVLHAYENNLLTDRFECHVRPGQGLEERWLFHWSQQIRSGTYAGGRIVQYTDITQRKKLEFAEREQRQLAEALRDIASILTSTLNLNEVLEKIFTNLDRIIPFDSAVITISEEETQWAARKRRTGEEEMIEVIKTADLQIDFNHLIGTMGEAAEPVIIADIHADGRLAPLAAQPNLNAYVGVPIYFQRQAIGFFNVLSAQPGAFTARDGRKLVAFAGQAAVAIQNARLFQQSQQLAMMEERQRLARDLHDSVSQTLFTCRTLAESALRRWERDPARARELLDEVHHLTGMALNEMRVLLLELRPAHLNRTELKELFEQYLRPIQERRGFELDMAIDDVQNLPAEVKIAIYRIAQEILNNIDKHAQARSVHIEVREESGLVILSVSDDGQGFDPAQLPQTSFGLGIMRERAEQIGGTFNLTSAPGRGTQVKVSWLRHSGG